MILDADMTVAPEDLPKFYHGAVATDKGEFINGSRLVYPREQDAMRLLNLIANFMFLSRCCFRGCSTSASPTRCAAPRCCVAGTKI